MKTRIFSAAAALFLTVFLLAATTNANARKAHFVSSLENAIDPAVHIENWMVNNLFWMGTETGSLNQYYDNKLLLESWMTDVNLWEFSLLQVVESDKILTLEPWMTDQNIWSKSESYYTDVPEEKMILESWMTDGKYWSQSEYR